MKGLVTKSTGSSYIVCTEDGTRVECRIKGKFRTKGIRSTNPIAVGDYVIFQEDSEADVPFITEIEDRRNFIVRRSSNLSKLSQVLASNLDLCLIVACTAHPETSVVFINRYIATAEAYRIPVLIAFNKSDLLTPDELDYTKGLVELYEGLGYHTIMCSAKEGDIEELKGLLKDKVTLIGGNSGVGKSTLLNRLIPGADQKTGDISEKHDTGMHTTTYSEMFQLPDGGWVIDSPGIKGFGLYDMKPEEVSHYFKEIFEVAAECRFGNCKHTCEPGCAVRKAVEEGRISKSRYRSYLTMIDDDGDDDKYRRTPQDYAL